jgi:hypothetical protein
LSLFLRSRNSAIVPASVARVILGVVGWAVPSFDAWEGAQPFRVVNSVAGSAVERCLYDFSGAL